MKWPFSYVMLSHINSWPSHRFIMVKVENSDGTCNSNLLLSSRKTKIKNAAKTVKQCFVWHTNTPLKVLCGCTALPTIVGPLLVQKAQSLGIFTFVNLKECKETQGCDTYYHAWWHEKLFIPLYFCQVLRKLWLGADP